MAANMQVFIFTLNPRMDSGPRLCQEISFARNAGIDYSQAAMHELGPPASHHLQAAQGWLELGNTKEAEIELNRLPSHFSGHPEVLRCRWEIQSRQNKWPASLKTAKELVRLDPANPDSWIKQSYSLHELKRTEQARQHLLAIKDRFPEVSTIPYNLACYACQLGELDEARLWLSRAVAIGGKEEIRSMSLSDHDLEPLWDFIRHW
jgi:predicted Zn-dependent protease